MELSYAKKLFSAGFFCIIKMVEQKGDFFLHDRKEKSGSFIGAMKGNASQQPLASQKKTVLNLCVRDVRQNEKREAEGGHDLVS